jgi:hypothetical protein
MIQPEDTLVRVIDGQGRPVLSAIAKTQEIARLRAPLAAQQGSPSNPGNDR